MESSRCSPQARDTTPTEHAAAREHVDRIIQAALPRCAHPRRPPPPDALEFYSTTRPSLAAAVGRAARAWAHRAHATRASARAFAPHSTGPPHSGPHHRAAGQSAASSLGSGGGGRQPHDQCRRPTPRRARHLGATPCASRAGFCHAQPHPRAHARPDRGEVRRAGQPKPCTRAQFGPRFQLSCAAGSTADARAVCERRGACPSPN